MYTRRDLVRALGVIPTLQAQPEFLARINHRLLGRTGRWVTPLGLGGQASLQWTIGTVHQLPANLDAALSDVATEAERRRIESTVADLHGVETNYFQDKRGLTQPPEPKAIRDADRVTILWTTAYAGPDPIRSYRIYSGDQVVLSVPFRPQTTLSPLSVTLPAEEAGEGPFRVVASTTAA